MSSGAHVGSIDAIRDFRAALHTFALEARDALTTYDLEMRRTLDWLVESEPARWQAEARKWDEAVLQAKIELQRCRGMPLPGGGTPSCMDEKKTLDRARARRQYAADKIEAVRKWGHVAQREAAEYAGRANQLTGLFDADLPRAFGMLDRVLTALESYRAVQPPGSELGRTDFAVPPAAAPSRSKPADANASAAEKLPAQAASPESPTGAGAEPHAQSTDLPRTPS